VNFSDESKARNSLKRIVDILGEEDFSLAAKKAEDCLQDYEKRNYPV
jgi:hypothetical protein